MRLIVFAFVFLSLFQSCAVRRQINENTRLQYLGVYELPFRIEFKGTIVGGLSGIDYNPSQDLYYIISDDRSDINPSRFYTARISLSQKGIDTVQFLNVHYLRNRQNEQYPQRKTHPASVPDPESIRFDARRRQLAWSSEGERSFGKDTILQNPFLQTMDTSGQFINVLEAPERFKVQKREIGVRHNGSWEGLSFADNYRKIWVSMEEPLYEDGSRATPTDSAWVRFLCFDASTKQQEAEYAYRIDPVAYPPEQSGQFNINGIPEILWVSDKKLLVLERSFTTGRNGCVVKIYLADFSAATDIRSVASLKSGSFHPAKKVLLLDLDSLPVGVYNVEGICFGPKLAHGRQSLILVADDNFSANDKTQFFLFTIEN